MEKINEKLLNMTQTVGQTVDQSVAYQKKTCLIIKHDFQKKVIYIIRYVYLIRYMEKKLLTKKHKLLKLCLEQSLK